MKSDTISPEAALFYKRFVRWAQIHVPEKWRQFINEDMDESTPDELQEMKVRVQELATMLRTVLAFVPTEDGVFTFPNGESWDASSMVKDCPLVAVRGKGTIEAPYRYHYVSHPVERNLLDCRALQEAVRNLYYAAHWTPDRECDAEALWTAVRDAAGIEPGKTGEILGPPRSPPPVGHAAPESSEILSTEYRLETDKGLLIGDGSSSWAAVEKAISWARSRHLGEEECKWPGGEPRLTIFRIRTIREELPWPT